MKAFNLLGIFAYTEAVYMKRRGGRLMCCNIFIFLYKTLVSLGFRQLLNMDDSFFYCKRVQKNNISVYVMDLNKNVADFMNLNSMNPGGARNT